MNSTHLVGCYKKLWLFLIIVACGGSAFAQHGGDPPGGEITAVVIDPFSTSIAYVATASGGIFRSTNGGLTWTTSESGLNNVNFVTSLAIAPSSPSTLYAGTDQGVFISTNSGATWTRKPFAVSAVVYSFAVDPASASTVYAGASSGGTAAVFRSTNGGDNWSHADTGFAFNAQIVSALAIDPSVPATLYAGTIDGVYKTTNSGGQWNPANSGFTQVPWVNSLALVPGTPSTLYVSTVDQGVFKSTNSASSWTASSTDLVPFMSAVAINPSTPATLYAATYGGLFTSGDAGVSWSHVSGIFFSSMTAVAIASGSPGTILAGATQGMFRSTDGGNTFNRANTGISSNAMASLSFPVGAAAPLYAGTSHSGVFRTADGGITWTDISFLDADAATSAVAFVANPGVLYVGTVGGGIYASANEFQSYYQGASPLASIRAFAVDPTTTSTVYAASDLGVYKTTNYTSSVWSLSNASSGLTNINVTALVINPSSPAVLYAGTQGGGVFTSTNNGTSWSPVNNGLPATAFVKAVAITPAGSTVYAAVTSATTGTDVYKTTDNAGSWSTTSTLISGVILEDLAIAPSNPTNLYACSASSGVFKSTNSGASWNLATTGLPSILLSSGEFIGCRVRVDPNDASTVYLSTSGRGVYKSTDGAASWAATGPPPSAPRKIRNQITSQ